MDAEDGEEQVRHVLPTLAWLPLKYSEPAVSAPDGLRGISEPRDPVPTLCWQASCRPAAFKIGPKAKLGQGAPFFVACRALAARSPGTGF